MGITLDEWKEWKTHPVTVEYYKALRNRLEELKQDWSVGAFTSESSDATNQKNAEAIGRADMLNALLETTYEGMVEDASGG